MRFIFLTFLFFSSTAIGASFEERASIAEKLSSIEKISQYETNLGQFIYKAVVTCIPPGSTEVGNLGKFSLVADVTKDGTVKNSEVKPITYVSKCFQIEFGAQSLPFPPEIFLENGALPILIEMDIVQ